ncbi:YlbF family regulator [Natronomonas salina]|uniref:YlbF family regulator n=1 Tax=Natronomonas salina TaxID=1710540 RepID=UPI0015B4B736|nr:YlbF family regulator [Natronomonas salina]QLD88016.1 YlbF family regulator [Natronomonas salina]
MSIETTPAERADELAEDLGDAIAEMPAYQEFVEAKAAVENDEELQQEIREFEQLREEFMMARQTGDATNDDLRKLQSTQEDLHGKPKMKAYLQAQSEIELKLQELDQLISDPLEIEFGQKAGGCCED